MRHLRRGSWLVPCADIYNVWIYTGFMVVFRQHIPQNRVKALSVCWTSLNDQILWLPIPRDQNLNWFQHFHDLRHLMDRQRSFGSHLLVLSLFSQSRTPRPRAPHRLKQKQQTMCPRRRPPMTPIASLPPDQYFLRMSRIVLRRF